MSSNYEEKSFIEGRCTVVMRSPKFNVHRKYLDYWGHNPNLRGMAKRIILRVAISAMRRWGLQYQHHIEAKILHPLTPDEPVTEALMRQIGDYNRHRAIFPPDLVFFIGASQWSHILVEAALTLPDMGLGYSGPNTAVKWRNLKGVVVPNMEGVIVLPKEAVIQALGLNSDCLGDQSVDTLYREGRP